MAENYIERARPQVIRIQNSMASASLPAFSEDDIANLRVIVRLVVEFKEFLHETPAIENSPADIEYLIGSILSGIDFFDLLEPSYMCLIGATASLPEWPQSEFPLFRATYLSKYAAFEGEQVFEPKCRLLRDLYKMQIVFAGIFHR
jgi:hypothetical protein